MTTRNKDELHKEATIEAMVRTQFSIPLVTKIKIHQVMGLNRRKTGKYRASWFSNGVIRNVATFTLPMLSYSSANVMEI